MKMKALESQRVVPELFGEALSAAGLMSVRDEVLVNIGRPSPVMREPTPFLRC